MKKNNLTFDVETAEKVWAPLIYDIGWIITSPQGKTLKKRRFIIEEIFQDEKLMSSAYYAKKVEVHYKELEHITVGFLEMIKILREDIKENDVCRVMAYNLNFDIRALVNSYIKILAKGKRSLKYKGKKVDYKKSFKMIIEGDYEFLDIWGLVCETVLLQDSFQDFVLDNGFITKKGNYKTSAEITYRFMFQDDYYIEKHTGLDDAIDESMIYHNLNRKDVYKSKTYKTGFCGAPWRVVKNFFNVA
jgi:hypothetical protein